MKSRRAAALRWILPLLLLLATDDFLGVDDCLAFAEEDLEALSLSNFVTNWLSGSTTNGMKNCGLSAR